MLNKEEYENAVNRRLDMVVRLAYTYLKNFAEAEDAAQEVFLRLFKEDISFDSAEAEKAWLIRVTANYCINRRRRYISITTRNTPSRKYHSLRALRNLQ